MQNYKDAIETLFNRKKNEIENSCTFSRPINNQEIKQLFESQLEMLTKQSQQKNALKHSENNDSNLLREKQKIKELQLTKLNQSKKELKLKLDKDFTLNTNNIDIVLSKDSELNQLKTRLSKLQLSKANNTDNFSSKYQTEVDQIENNYKNMLKQCQEHLEVDLNNYKNTLKNEYINKKLSFNNKFNEQNLNSKEDRTVTNLIKEKKVFILKKQAKKLEAFKLDFETKNKQTTEQILQANTQEHNITLYKIKENFDNLKGFYTNHKNITITQQTLANTISSVNRLRNAMQNKNVIFKNFIENCNYYIKKKSKMFEKNTNLTKFINYEHALEILKEILDKIMFENVYEYLFSDLSNEKIVVINYLEDLTRKYQSLLMDFSSEKKIQLNMLISNINFNF